MLVIPMAWRLFFYERAYNSFIVGLINGLLVLTVSLHVLNETRSNPYVVAQRT